MFTQSLLRYVTLALSLLVVFPVGASDREYNFGGATVFIPGAGKGPLGIPYQNVREPEGCSTKATCAQFGKGYLFSCGREGSLGQKLVWVSNLNQRAKGGSLCRTPNAEVDSVTEAFASYAENQVVIKGAKGTDPIWVLCKPPHIGDAGNRSADLLLDTGENAHINGCQYPVFVPIFLSLYREKLEQILGGTEEITIDTLNRAAKDIGDSHYEKYPQVKQALITKILAEKNPWQGLPS